LNSNEEGIAVVRNKYIKRWRNWRVTQIKSKDDERYHYASLQELEFNCYTLNSAVWVQIRIFRVCMKILAIPYLMLVWGEDVSPGRQPKGAATRCCPLALELH
jgi:hypothetical protein